MSLVAPKLASLAMLAGVVASTAAVWMWGDAGLDKVAPVPPAAVAPPPPVAASAPPPEARALPTLTGVAIAESTNTLVIDGRRLVLAGVMPVNHVQAVAAFKGFVASAGPLGCREASGGNWTCEITADGTDVGEVAVLSGLAFIGPGAPRSYVDAEKTAKQRKAGIWGAS